MNLTKLKKQHNPHSHRKTSILLASELVLAAFFILLVYVTFIVYPSQDEQVKIGSTYMTMNNSFYPVLNEQIANYVEDHHDRLYNRDPALIVNKQVEELHTFIRQRMNAIIINPVDGNSRKIQNALRLAKKKGIKIIVVDSQMKSDKYADCTILSDNYHAGQLCAQHLLKRKTAARILLLEHYSAYSANNRIQGFTDTIRKSPRADRFHIVGKINTYGQSEITLPLVEKALKKGPKFDTIMALNDQAAVGALAAIDEVKLKRQIDVYSVDGSENMKKLLGVNQNAIATAAQTPLNMGKTAVKIAYKLIAGKKVPRTIILPVYLITDKNINRYNVLGWQ
ncbi:sugar ABC transporter substrate-binding protein [Lactobacillus sp. W8093]|uniref:sugar ABC transporter substrate-binding protein n=1 Tax=Lactobacillus sp. W8093 TaxID=2751038 RepID=UPI0018EF82C2|nr:sugar ABC transporter substrate-binding protein [Lactobacillus sp. W8093]MBI0109644.1 sugar ABC transporter substrate-binding protein [Lactobacillus sp. W8093]